MEVPYLKWKPKKVPVDVGRQLFVHGFLLLRGKLQPLILTPQAHLVFLPGWSGEAPLSGRRLRLQ